MERFIVSARKYRPNSFENLIGQENIAKTLKNSILRNQLAHAYLFCGPRGVGKTTSARIFARTINCLNPTDNMESCGVCESCLSFAEGRSYSIHELDAASNNSVEDIRQLNELVRIPPQIGKYSVYIIDEVHMLSQSAFNAFLKTLEEPPAHAIFILATTEKHKILPTILSRCQTYDFNRISVEDIVRNLTDISAKESVKIDLEALHIIAQKADGAMRDALTLFDQTVAFCGENVTYEQVISTLNVLDYEYYIRLTNHFLNAAHSDVLLIFDEILSKGFNALHFIGGLSTHFRNLLVCKDRNTARLLELAPSIIERYREQAERCSLNFLYDALNITSACEGGYKASGHPRLHIEFALFKLCRINSPEWVSGEIKQSVAAKVAVQPAASTLQLSVPSSSTTVSPTVSDVVVPVKEVTAPSAPKASTLKATTTSIKDLMKAAEDGISAKVDFTPKAVGEESFDKEKLEQVWVKMADSEKALPRLATTLCESLPEIGENNEIHFYVSNELQRNWIQQKCQTRLLEFLKINLNNKLVKLLIEVVPDGKKENKLYMPEEKAKFLLENYPELRELQKDLKLELK
ncbi:MAG: DNA polymerase III subunit gamma/tau [Bacteroidales bacterium]|jgi:DNA polymerase-3 subunit gamma/tau